MWTELISIVGKSNFASGTRFFAEYFPDFSEYFLVFQSIFPNFEYFPDFQRIFPNFARKKAVTGFLGSRFFSTMLISEEEEAYRQKAQKCNIKTKTRREF